MTGTSKAACVVVLERGATWPAWVREACHRRATDAIIEAQGEFELPTTFAQRVGKKMRELAERGVAIKLSVIVTGGDSSAAVEAMRRGLAASAISAMSSHQSDSELVLALEPQDVVREEARHRLLAFAGGLCENLNGEPVTVSVKFSDFRHESGFVPTLRSAHAEGFDRVASGGND